MAVNDKNKGIKVSYTLRKVSSASFRKSFSFGRVIINFIKVISIMMAFVVIVLAIFLAYTTIVDFRPSETFGLIVNNNSKTRIETGKPFKVTTFNIGYCGLDKNQDFFMDGGTMSRSSGRVQTMKNLEGITDFLVNDDADIILLQEVDENSSRSNHINEYKHLTERLSGTLTKPLSEAESGVQSETQSETLSGTKVVSYSDIFAINYRTAWVPIPAARPMGSVLSGLLVLNRFMTSEAVRYQFPGGEKWPVQLFELDRCFSVSRLPVFSGSSTIAELVVINLHLSAFDKGGEIRKLQLEYLQNYIAVEQSKGSYIIIGGDWNHVLPGTDLSSYKSTEEWPFWLQKLPASFSPQGFVWAVDGKIPSVRTDAKAYEEGVNFLSVIDGFLVSSNIEVIEVKGHSLGFEFSDHNPVTGVFSLK
ncbi:MAG: endonuclease/exonuclease/phosphatase family protein [Clostridiales bacterium]|nr:endonuclease/exonuclease/phosphatase family protein [Clostridiales bacterium]